MISSIYTEAETNLIEPKKIEDELTAIFKDVIGTRATRLRELNTKVVRGKKMSLNYTTERSYKRSNHSGDVGGY